MCAAPDFAPVWCNSSSGTFAYVPPTAPPLALNSSTTF
jgi:hypothetical protein